MDLYDSLDHPKLKSKNWDFVSHIDSRIYTEWCMCEIWTDHRNYNGKGFTEFIIEQTHHELIRSNYLWNEKEKKFDNIDNEQYKKSRTDVLGGLTLRAIELSSDWGNSYPPSRIDRNEGKINYIYDDKRNLRTDLKDYIKRYQGLMV